MRYCIIGGFAVGFHGYPRFTNDIDIIIESTLSNAKKIIKAIKEFGISSPDLTADDFIQENKVIQLGYEPVRIDFLTSLEGLNFKDIWVNREIGTYGNEKVFFIGYEELIKSKKIAKRPQDLIDLQKLKKRKGEK